MLMTHALAEMYDCLPLIEDEAALVAAARAGVQSVGATIIGSYEVRYVPHGLTIALFLAESHIVLTTWPEHRLLLVDVLLCNPEMDFNRVLAEVKRCVCPDGEMTVHHVPRKIAARP
ncbi:S-adenosylmethionine decarboxylase [Rhodopseudomonas palustris]|uniref:S-adenosylmethionine decarboxylase-like n=1 Tax=Rhodopseudomonas palustris (strain BisB5) TaxID=316057 RepID=Q134C0_RHOPS|nr:S-adenosylmethionine decarboxylase-like [Rhodopseudomonas palustris BisB5]MBB1093658.1 S-adenosylmethionine decarboxylase [Rhodopseudomonas palustris]